MRVRLPPARARAARGRLFLYPKYKVESVNCNAYVICVCRESVYGSFPVRKLHMLDTGLIKV